MFINISPSMLETLYFDEENTVEQIIAPLGALLRNGSTTFMMRIIVGRLDQYGKDMSGLGMTGNAWTLRIYASSMSRRIAYQVSNSNFIF
jgi:hypothetical protein